MARKPRSARARPRPAAGPSAPLLDSARALLGDGAAAHAEQVCLGGLAAAPDDPELLLVLGLARLELGRAGEAAAPLAAAAAALPGRADAQSAAGRALAEAGDAGAALEPLERLAALEPRDAGVWGRLGLARLDAGRLDAAGEAFARAFDLDPVAPGAALNLARSRRFAAGDAALVARVEALAARAELAPELRSDALFALGKIRDDLGEPERAFECYARANALVHRPGAFDRVRHAAAIDALIETFDAALIERCRGFGSPSALPVLVVGMPRSGTTLIEQILAAHPHARGAGELPDLDAASRAARAVLGSRLAYPRCAAQMTGAAATRLAAPYVERLAAIAGGASRVVDKMPANFMHLGLAALLLPGARVVHCRRDALDNCTSIFTQQFETGNLWAYDLGDIACFHREYRRLMAHWRAVLPLPMLEVDYEDVVADLEGAARALVAHVGLDWDPRCLEFHRGERTVTSASNWQVRQPLYASSVGRWRRYRGGLAPLLEALGEPAPGEG